MDQFDPWQVIPREVFTPLYSRLLISTAFAVVSPVGCLGVSSVNSCKQILLTLTVASDLGLHCLNTSPNWEASLN